MRFLLPFICFALAACVDMATGAAPEAEVVEARQAQPQQSRALYFTLIQEVAAKGKPRAALAYLDDYDARWPNDPAATLLRGEQHLKAKQYEEAGKAFNKLLGASVPLRARALSGLGEVAASKNHWNTATRSFRESAKLAPTNARTLNNLGYGYLKLDKPQTALKVLKRAMELDEASTVIRNNYVLALSRAGQDAEVSTILAAMPENEAQKLLNLMASFKPLTKR